MVNLSHPIIIFATSIKIWCDNKFTGALLESKGYSPHDRDGCDYYSQTVMDLEYQTLLDIANDNLQLGRSVVLDAPFIAYFSNRNYIDQLREKFDWQKVKPLVLQVTISPTILKERMQARALERDTWKLTNWDTYLQSIQEKQCLWENVEMKEFDNTPRRLIWINSEVRFHVRFGSGSSN